MSLKLPAAHMALPARLERTGLLAQLDQIVYKARRNAEMARSLTVTMPLIDIRSWGAVERLQEEVVECELLKGCRI
ncbi:hypothetical protein [Mesorhizobium temperatum]|uniref:hypothetical protein n=1 Tax=Mesorhizobium temperatum TaxID=241416 RepID=UPI001FD9FF31|nr:hypothetical protein [Mesorhizobium temperatum]